MPDTPPLPEAYCLTCGYRLDTASAPARCPECGRKFDPDDPDSMRMLTSEPRHRRRRWLPIIVIMLAIITVILLFAQTMPSAF